MAHILLTGAAGFIGSHLADRFLSNGHHVTGVDNFVRGVRGNLAEALQHSAFRLIEANAADPSEARRAFCLANEVEPVSAVWHMAANSDISAGTANPGVDLRDTFLTTFQTLAMMRELRIPELAFASSSAIYGPHESEIYEDT